jgi:hypothetical protein
MAAPAVSQPVKLKFDDRERVATNVPVRDVKTRRYQILGLVYS